MAGTIQLSMSQQFDVYGDPLAGGQLYLMVAGTVSTPQNGFQDLALTIPLPNPVPLDAAGRVPQFFLADGYIKVRLQDKHGVVQLASDNILVIGPSSGSGGGGATIDATTIFQTGDIKPRYGTGSLPGWVRCNGLTIGSAASSPSATERGNADCMALFEFLWVADSALAVSGGRGGSAHSDWLANKTIATPDWRGRLIAGMDDMGNSPAGRLNTAGSGVNGVLLGASGGAQNEIISQGHLPNIALSASVQGTINVTSDKTFFQTNTSPIQPVTGFATGGSNYIVVAAGSTTTAGNVSSSSGLITISGGTSSLNGNVSQVIFNTTQPTMVATFYIKL